MKNKWQKIMLSDEWFESETESLPKQSSEFMDEPLELSRIPAYDEDNDLAKLGDFWPRPDDNLAA